MGSTITGRVPTETLRIPMRCAARVKRVHVVGRHAVGEGDFRDRHVMNDRTIAGADLNGGDPFVVGKRHFG